MPNDVGSKKLDLCSKIDDNISKTVKVICIEKTEKKLTLTSCISKMICLRTIGSLYECFYLKFVKYSPFKVSTSS